MASFYIDSTDYSQQTWICPQCQNELGVLNGWCEYCKANTETIVYNPDNYYIRKIRVRHIMQGDKPLTPQEELFAQLFNHDVVLVKDMNPLERKAHREELVKMIQEAKVRVSAIDHVEGEEQKSKRRSVGAGFERSVNVDETSTDAINTIKERQKRLSKKEQIQEQLDKLYKMAGMDSKEAAAEAQRKMTAGAILGQIKSGDNQSQEIIKGNQVRSPLSQDNGFVIQKSKEEIEAKPKEAPKPFNPFEKKS